MSTDLENTYELWLKIKKRDVNSKNFEDISELISKGVILNLQDANCKLDTALHFAVRKGDLNCVEFLLQIKPNLQISNSDGYTASDLAKKLEFFEIYENLLHSEEDGTKEPEKKTV